MQPDPADLQALLVLPVQPVLMDQADRQVLLVWQDLRDQADLPEQPVLRDLLDPVDHQELQD